MATVTDPEKLPADVELVRSDPELPPVGIVDRRAPSTRARIVLALIAILGAVAWTTIALARGEQVNAVWFVVAAICTYLIGYRFYAKLIERRLVKPRDDHATAAEALENGTDFMPTDRRVLFGHHFAAIAGAGPLVGPVLAAQMGYLPGIIWIVVGVVLAGAVQDYLVLVISTRRGGRSLGQMARDEMGPIGGIAATAGIFVIMIMLVAVLGLVVVNALGESPWGVFSIAMTIPIALFMGVYLRFLRPGKVSEVTAIGVTLLLTVIVAGGWVSESSWGSHFFALSKTNIAWLMMGYGFVASVLPVWLLLAPRDYLATFMKVGTIVMLAAGIVIARPVSQLPAVSEFAFNSAGPAFAGSLFPFLFVTIACGALSGFHSLVASGTTPKLLEKESQALFIGYGGMLTESFVAVIALVTASILNQHLYFAINAPTAVTGGTAETAAAYVNGLPVGGPKITGAQLTQAASDIGEKSIVSRTGGAPTLAIGISQVMSNVFGGNGFKAFWYHFAIMFEALFILTTVDAGTRVARFMLSDALGGIAGPLRRFSDAGWRPGAWLCSAVVVGGWGSILLMGVTDPLGGINTLYPLFGIANQLLAAIALTVVTVVVVKKGQFRWAWIPGLPLAWDITVTMSASSEKVFSDDPAIGYWKQHQLFVDARNSGLTHFKTAGTPEAIDAVIRNTLIQGTLTAVFAALVLVVFAIGMWTCVRAVRSGGLPTSEDPPVPSRLFAPSGLLATDVEREVAGQWTDRAFVLARPYQRYVEHLNRHHPDRPVPTEKEFWRARHAEADSRPSARCC